MRSVITGTLGAGLIVLWAVLEWQARSPRPPAPAPTPAAQPYFPLAQLAESADTIRCLPWDRVVAAGEYLGSRPLQAEKFLVQSSDLSEPPVRFLRGLVFLSLQRVEQAAAEWRALPVGGIPPDLLYPAWRVLAVTSPEVPNPFQEPIRKAASDQLLPDLPRARVLAAEGQFADSLAAYLLTDPAAWVSVDTENFRLMTADQSTQADANRILLAAVKGGRMVPESRQAAARLLLDARGQPPGEEALRSFLKKHPEAQAAADRAARTLVEDRRFLLENRFAEILSKHAATPPRAAADETVIVVVMAAAQLGRRDAFDPWARELARRFPQPEVATWIETLAPR